MKFNGSLLRMKVTATDKLVQNTRDISVTINTNEIDVTDADSGGWVELLGGLRSWTGKATGVVNFAAVGGNATVGDLIDMAIARVLVNCLFTTSIVGDKTFEGAGLFTNVQFQTSHEGEVTWSADVKGSGPIVPTTTA